LAHELSFRYLSFLRSKERENRKRAPERISKAGRVPEWQGILGPGQTPIRNEGMAAAKRERLRVALAKPLAQERERQKKRGKPIRHIARPSPASALAV
jgi:hypothetical protein